MKMILVLLITALFSNSAFAKEVLAALETENGGEAYLISSQPPKAGIGMVSFANVRIEIDGHAYRIANKGFNAFLKKFCAEYDSSLPFTYNDADVKDEGLFGIGAETIVEIGTDGIVRESGETIVVGYAMCLSEPY